MLAAAGLGDDLLLLPGDQRCLDADRRQIGLHRLGNVGERGGGIMIQRHLESVGIAGLDQQGLRLADHPLKRIVGQRRRQALRQERLLHHPGVRHDVLLDAGIVDGELYRLPHFRARQRRMVLVHRQIHRRCLDRRHRGEFLLAGNRLQLLGFQIAGNVDIALLQRQQLRRGIGDVADDQPLGVRLHGGIRVGFQRDSLARLPGFHLERAGPGAVGLQPAIAHIAVLGIGQSNLLLHHAADIGRQAIQHEAGGLAFRQGKHNLAALGADQLLDIFLGVAELGDDEARRFVQDHRPVQRKHHVLGGDRRAGCEFRAGLQGKGEGQPVRGNIPALRQFAREFLRMRQFRAYQPLIDIAAHLVAGELEALLRVQADDVVDLLRHHHHVFRRGGGHGSDRCGGKDRGGREQGTAA